MNLKKEGQPNAQAKTFGIVFGAVDLCAFVTEFDNIVTIIHLEVKYTGSRGK